MGAKSLGWVAWETGYVVVGGGSSWQWTVFERCAWWCDWSCEVVAVGTLAVMVESVVTA